MKKNNAFTITELLVVMIVSTIVISLSFIVLTMVQKQLKIISSNLEKKKVVENIDRLFWMDFNESKKAYFYNKDIFFEKELDTIAYHLEKEFIIRDKDSFPVKINNKTFYLNGEKITDGNIDALKFEFEENYLNSSLFVFKNKDASFYMNQ